MRIGIVGGGFGLNVHLPVFQSQTGVEVVALADSGSGKIKQSLPNQVKYLDSWRALLEEDIDIVSIATPPAIQKDIVLAALSKGKHIFCEKPFGLNLQEAQEIYAISSQERASATAVNFQFRYEPGIALLYKQIRSGAVGRVRAVNVSWMTAGRANPHSIWSWRNDKTAGGGVTAAFFSHVADLICWLTDCDPVNVYGQEKILVGQRPDSRHKMQPVTAEDLVLAQIQLSNGITAACQVTNCQFGGDGMHIEVQGELGVLDYHHKPPFTSQDQTLTLRQFDSQHHFELMSANAQMADSRIGPVFDCVSDFLAHIRGNSHPSHPTFKDGLRAHRIMHALKLSASSGQVQLISEA